MIEDKKEEPEEYKVVPSQKEFEILRAQVAELASIIEDLTSVEIGKDVEERKFETHYQLMIINLNMMSSIVEALIDRQAKKDGLDPVLLRISLFERAIERSNEGKNRWKGPLAPAYEESDEITVKALKARLQGLRNFLKEPKAEKVQA